MNVGPTFDNPKTSSDDDTVPPRLISWIARNPQVKGDTSPDEDYKKTLIWSVPPTAVVGVIRVDKDGRITFEGRFSTPRSPGGKDAADLDDVEKENLISYLNEERALVDDFYERLRKAGRIPPPGGRRPIARAAAADYTNILSSTLPVAVTVRMPQRIRAGTSVAASVTATTSLDGVALGPTRIASATWTVAGRAVAKKPAARLRFAKRGRYQLAVRVRDVFGARGTATRVVVVRPR